ncbi:MAG: pre-peptidase C-terminal domain-containing protein [Sedimentisphaerales bacterium]|nr:pre-peptidase C-terminal domain-containing protein [Sedimentisphaerales bacterium]
MGPVVVFDSGEGPTCTLRGFTILGGAARSGGAILCDRSSPTIANCVIAGNRTTRYGGGAVDAYRSSAIFQNCTIVDNYSDDLGGAISSEQSTLTLTNCIVWGNTPDQIHVLSGTAPALQYCNIQGGASAGTNMNADPNFAEPGRWVDSQDATVPVEPDTGGAVWTHGDYHLLSEFGRYHAGAWTDDACTSTCVDGGDPEDDWRFEPNPNGGRINLGAYGGTGEASKSPAGPGVTIVTLESSVPTTPVSGAPGSEQFFQIDVPANATQLVVQISGGTGDADLYVKYGAVPTESDYDHRPYVPGNEETVTIPNPTAGMWFIMVQGVRTFSALTLVATYSSQGVVPPIIPLTSGVPVVNLAGAASNEKFYKIEVPAGQTLLKIEIYGGTGDADLYVKKGAKPTTSSYDYCPHVAGNAEKVEIANPSAETWYVMIRGPEAYSGLTLVATYSTGSDTTTTLQSGVPLSNLAGAAGSESFYKIEVPAAQGSLKIEISGGTGDADLYVKKGAKPTTTDYDYRPYRAGSEETVEINNPAPGTWYVMLRGYHAYAGLTLVATYSGQSGLPPASVVVPNVVSQTQSWAQSAITSAGLVVGTISQAYSSAVAAGRVISQNPLGGATVAVGSAVNLTVSKGPDTGPTWVLITTFPVHMTIPSPPPGSPVTVTYTMSFPFVPQGQTEYKLEVAGITAVGGTWTATPPSGTLSPGENMVSFTLSGLNVDISSLPPGDQKIAEIKFYVR